MGTQAPRDHVLLRWSEFVPTAEVQDPLGLSLRGSARLASRLLYCITSITPRARYFSFIPWCVHDYRQREKGKPQALGLKDAVALREQALTLGCVAHHAGEPCDGGSLVGSRDAKKWFQRGEKVADFVKLKKFSKNPAFSIYFNSLVNLGFFVTETELPDAEDEEHDGFTLDDIELSELGLRLARHYDSAVAGLTATKHLAATDRTCTLSSLADFGRVGGLCELADPAAADRQLLRDIFFARVGQKGESHHVRRMSLLLLLELCRQFAADGWVLGVSEFWGAVYYGELANNESRLGVTIPPALTDIAARWRMFYFHHSMGVALEGVFSWLVTHLGTCGLAGADLRDLAARLDEPAVARTLSEVLGVEVKAPFGDLTPGNLFAAAGLPDGDLDAGLSRTLDVAVRSLTPFSEDTLEEMIHGNQHLHSTAGLAIPMVLLATTLGRYAHWEATNYGQWLASIAADPYLDLVPPVVSAGLTRRFGSWWKCPWKELAAFVLQRYAVRQHQTMSYEKSWSGDRCLLMAEGDKVRSPGGYEKIGLGNPRVWSAIRVLKDLGLLADDEEGVTRLTNEGADFLTRELAKEAADEVR